MTTNKEPETPEKRHPATLCCGYKALLSLPHPVMWNEFNKVVQCHNCGEVYESKLASEKRGMERALLLCELPKVFTGGASVTRREGWYDCKEAILTAITQLPEREGK